jgi:hypothetical protein
MSLFSGLAVERPLAMASCSHNGNMIVALSTWWLHVCHPRWACRGMVISPTHASPGLGDHTANLHLCLSALLCCKFLFYDTFVEAHSSVRSLALRVVSGGPIQRSRTRTGPSVLSVFVRLLRQSMTASTQKERKQRGKDKKTAGPSK